MATVLAAPMSSTFCADLGAEVVKLELPDGSDMLRSLMPIKDGHSLHWKVTNRGKRGITLDVRKPEGRELFLQLLPGFDVLVENFRVGTLERWGLDPETLWQANPRLYILRLTGFGQTGPYAQRPGFARIFEAMSGFAYLTGEPDAPPQHMNFSLGDAVAGIFGAFSIAAAMTERRSHPEQPGRAIDLSATEAMLRLLDPLAVEFEQLGEVRQRVGSKASFTTPSNVFRTQDRVWVTLVGASNTIFRRLCNAMGKGQLADDPLFDSPARRLSNSDALDQLIADWCRSLDFDALEAVLCRCEVPFSRVNSIRDVMSDPHFLTREAIVRLPDPELGELPAPCIVPRFSGYTPAAPRTGPAPGEHNPEVFGELGLDAPELVRLRAARVI
jgi:crotonobetainyl-CoA:carnitine CoA-transferase CaiB-like acyl-CoA transferase